MKKLLLIGAIGIAATAANAQQATSSVVKTDVNTNFLTTGKSSAELLKAARALRGKTGSYDKTTASGTRLYNYVDALIGLRSEVNDQSVLPYMWRRPDMLAMYGNGSGGVAPDTIQFSSYASILNPQWDWFMNAGFNDPGYEDIAPAPFALTNGNAYTVDSVAVYGVYGRNPNKLTVVDTLRLTFVYGANVRTQTFSGADITTNFGGPITVAFPAYDTATGGAARTSGTAPALITKDVLLTAADSNNGGLNRFAVAIGQNIPAGNLVGVSVTFLSGEAYTPWDTVFFGTGFPVTFKYGMFRPIIFEENAGGFPNSNPVNPRNLNGGAFKFLPDNGNGWLTSYVPGAAYLSGDWPYELPYVDYVISASNAPALNVAGVAQAITTDAFPNPATSEVAVPFRVNNAADVKVTLTNTVGQVVSTQSFNNVTAGKATFNVANLANGVYFYSVEASGQTQTGRVSVSH